MTDYLKNKKELPKSAYPYWARFTLNNPLRRKLLDRDKIIKEAEVSTGIKVFELGFGVGFFTEYLAKAVGQKGVVYCQDVEPRMLESLKKNMKNFTITENIKPMITSSIDLKLEDNSIDLIFAANVFEEIDKEGLLEGSVKELGRISRKDTKLFFMEHIGGVGIPRIQRIEKALKYVGFKQVNRRQTRFNVYAKYVFKGRQ